MRKQRFPREDALIKGTIYIQSDSESSDDDICKNCGKPVAH